MKIYYFITKFKKKSILHVYTIKIMLYLFATCVFTTLLILIFQCLIKMATKHPDISTEVIFNDHFNTLFDNSVTPVLLEVGSALEAEDNKYSSALETKKQTGIVVYTKNVSNATICSYRHSY